MSRKLEITYLWWVPDSQLRYNLTWSSTLFEFLNTKILVDFGLYQWIEDEDRKNSDIFFTVEDIDYVIVTHAHLDHIWRIPYLVKKWFKGIIFMTPETKQLAIANWLDTVKIKKQEIERLKNKNEKLRKKLYTFLKIKNWIEWNNLIKGWYRVLGKNSKNKLLRNLKKFCDNKFVKLKYDNEKLNDNPDYIELIINRLYNKVYTKLSEHWIIDEKDIENILYNIDDLLFDEADVFKTVSLIKEVDFNKVVKLSNNISFKYWSAGHILWSATVMLKFDSYRCLIAQDLWRLKDNLFDRKIRIFSNIDYLQLESTYSWKKHFKLEKAKEILFNEVFPDKVNWHVLIAAFSIDRAQFIMKLLYDFIRSKYWEKFSRKIYYDWNLIEEVNKIFLSSDYEKYKYLLSPIFKKLSLSTEYEVNKFLKEINKSIIISSSWMLQGWAIMKYLKKILPDSKSKLILTGYQASETLGWKLLRMKKWEKVLINWEPVEVRCKIVKIDWFSSHADHNDLKKFVKLIKSNTKKKLQVVLTHYSNPYEIARDLENYWVDVKVAQFGQKIIKVIK